MSQKGLKIRNQIDLPAHVPTKGLKETASPKKKKTLGRQALSVRNTSPECNEKPKETKEPVAPFEIFTDTFKESCAHCGLRREKTSPRPNTEDLKSLLCDSSPSENYYKQLSEERMLALKDTLEENEVLYHRIAALQDELDQYRLFVDQLKELQKVLPDDSKELVKEEVKLNDTVLVDSD